MRKRVSKILVGDFETTVYKGQTDTAVWASACVELFTEDVKIFHSIGEQLEYFYSLDCNVICYYHNLKFDGNFWLSYLMRDLKYKQAADSDENDVSKFAFHPIKEMKNNTFTYSISNMGQWYKIVIKHNRHVIELRDSLKLLPFSVKEIGESFKTKHKKLEMEYTGYRFPGCEITDSEKKYIGNDVLVVKEALEIMFTEGHTGLTIGSCCLEEYKKSLGGNSAYDMWFPNLYDIPVPSFVSKDLSVGEYIRKSYRGGWCYLARGKERKQYGKGITADVNSLYPSMMSSESGNKYPIGEPEFWRGNFIPDEALQDDKYYFIRIKTRFYLKPGYLPFIQIKNTFRYKGTESLETSDVYNREDGKYYAKIKDSDGNIVSTAVTMTLTMTDFELIKEHYNLVEFEILDGCWFRTKMGIFDEYMEKYKKIKQTSKGAMRQLAKLFLNNLYGKMASSTNSSFKVAYLKDDGSIGFYCVDEEGKKPGYIPVGSAITSYARNFTIRAAQKNYHGPDKPGFIYADTDSIHCDLPASELKGIVVHPTNFCCWDLESTWDTAFFVRQKTYIEHVIEKDLEPVEEPYYDVKCAGMPANCKKLFIKSMERYEITEDDNFNERETEVINKHYDITDFTLGLTLPGKLMPRRIPGGVLLVETDYQMR